MKQINKNDLGAMLKSLADSFAEERKQSEPFKELFAKGSTHTGLLRELEHKMTGHVLDACEVYEERLGIKINNNQYNVLLALPFLIKVAEQEAEKDGIACSVDKAYYIMSEQLNKLVE